jgi:imidazolonepropionase-like amidohydrolase
MTRSSRLLIKQAILILLLAVGMAAIVSAQTKRIKPPAEHLIIKCKLLINPDSGTTIENAVIEISQGRILAVGKTGEFPLPPEVKVLDFSDKYIIPGLIDSHGHLYGGITGRPTTNPVIPTFYLAAGVTTVEAPGSMDPGGDLAMENRINTGTFLGPRYFLAGEYLEMDPVTVRWMNPVMTPEEAKLKVDLWALQGITMIKVYADMRGDVLRAAIEEAHEHGLKVTAHIGAVSYKEAIEMGVDQLFHGVLAMSDTRPPDVNQRDYKKWGESTALLDLERPEIREVFSMAARARVVLTPTAVVADPIDLKSPYMLEQKKYYTPEAWAGLEKFAARNIFGPADIKKNLQFIKMAHDAGCILTTGTDLVLLNMVPGYSLWREMDLFAEAGLKPMDVLKSATINGAYAIGRRDLLGSVEPGKLADFVILNANPLEDLHNVRTVHRVVKGGVVYNPEELLKPLVGKVY